MKVLLIVLSLIVLAAAYPGQYRGRGRYYDSYPSYNRGGYYNDYNDYYPSYRRGGYYNDYNDYYPSYRRGGYYDYDPYGYGNRGRHGGFRSRGHYHRKSVY